MNRELLYAQIMRLLFKYNLVPENQKDELAFIKELNRLLNR